LSATCIIESTANLISSIKKSSSEGSCQPNWTRTGGCEGPMEHVDKHRPVNCRNMLTEMAPQ
jgi:hypothetical protein